MLLQPGIVYKAVWAKETLTTSCGLPWQSFNLPCASWKICGHSPAVYIYILTKQRLCNSGSAFLYSCNPYRCSRVVSKVGKPWSARWVSMSIYEYRMRLRFQRCLFVLIESTWRCGYYERLSSPRRTPARHITRGRQARQSVDAFRPWRKSALSTPGSDDQAIWRNQPRSSKIHVAQFATSEIVPFKTWFAGTAVQAQKLFRTMFASICLSFQDHFQHRDWHKGRQWNLGIRWHQMTSNILNEYQWHIINVRFPSAPPDLPECWGLGHCPEPVA